jgi:hypothetical protein
MPPSAPVPVVPEKAYSFITLSPAEQVWLLRLMKTVNKTLREHNFIGTYKLRVHEKDGKPALGLMPTNVTLAPSAAAAVDVAVDVASVPNPSSFSVPSNTVPVAK